MPIKKNKNRKTLFLQEIMCLSVSFRLGRPNVAKIIFIFLKFSHLHAALRRCSWEIKRLNKGGFGWSEKLKSSKIYQGNCKKVVMRRVGRSCRRPLSGVKVLPLQLCTVTVEQVELLEVLFTYLTQGNISSEAPTLGTR